VTFEAEWNGGSDRGDLQIIFEDGDDNFLVTKRIKDLVRTHFGSGILTFNMGVIISTCPGYDLWVSGPVNEFKDGIQALTALVETDWMPFTFTMNWKFTRANLKVRFEKGEPFCFFFPIKHGLLERFNPTFRQLHENPELQKQYNLAFSDRSEALKMLRATKFEKLEEEDRKRAFQGWYMRGEMPDGTKVADHKKRVEPKPFERAAHKERRTNKP
jgi:hypothetical protein